MNPRSVAHLYAFGRAVIGAALIAGPERAGAPWLGRAARRPAAQVGLTALGARDVGIGLGAAWALREGSGVRPWLLAAAAADATDLAATIRHRHALPTAGVVGIGAMAAGGAALGLWLRSAID